MTTWQKVDGKIRKIDGKIVVNDDDCCCCDCDLCCESMQAGYSQLLYDVTSASCTGVTGQLTQAGWEAIDGGPDVTVFSAMLECLGDLGNRQASFRCTVHMESSAPCEFEGVFEADGTCWPPDVSFTFDSGSECCGVMTIRFYAPDCPYPCYCRCDNHCMEEDLVAMAVEHDNCPDVDGSYVDLTCDGTCSWSGSGSLGGACSYDFELRGASADNCTGDYTLKIKSGGVTVWEGKDNCTESLCYPTSLVFGPLELPCCDGGTVKIYITLPP